ncbi:hypothetical protein [Marinicella gelatinilytica]|uniref:hypothetical protein n=1 Tax=Marinicella gelatinilytica TaxID=2996017 RepID=UPI002260E6EB|nr:hypothetical protein [Marinicella gelatinilytica]MCX7546014.1 hypothetical protein [Marinicella gelatinilytica]
MSHVTTLWAISTVPSLMDCDDMIFVDGFVSESWPSNGSGGPVNTGFRSIYINSQLGNRTFYYHIPSSYQSGHAMPIMFLFHGAGGAGTAPAGAKYSRDMWLNESQASGFIIVAQVATGSQGGWIQSNMVPILIKILDDMEARYNIEKRRIYAWGYSAGGNVLHELALYNAGEFAGYAISGADLSHAISGGVYPSTASRKLPVVLSVGQSDPRYPSVVNDYNLFQQHGWQAGYNVWFDVYSGGHHYFPSEPAAVWDKLCISTHID